MTKLTGWAKQIAEVLKCDDATAENVFDYLCCDGFDFSESSQSKFVRECKFALKVISI